MTDLDVKEKAAGEAAKQNGTTEILNDSDPFDNPVSVVLTDEGNGVKSFKKENGDTFLTGPLGVVFIAAGKSEDNAQKVCGALEVVGRYRDKKGNGWGRVVVWHDGDDTRHELKISEGDLSTKQSEVFAALASGGLEIFAVPSSGRPNRVVDYIRSYPREALPKLCSTKSFGWHDKGHAFVLPDRVIGDTESGEGVLFDGNEADAPKYASKGTLKDWQDNVASIALCSNRITFFTCIAFAAPLARLVNEPSGGFHLVGDSSLGKSSALRALCSVFASAASDGESGEMASWRATDNGLEAFCQSHTDLPMICDEIGQADGRNIGKVLYMIGNESGKRRMTKGLQNKAAASWRLLLASSGEVSAEEFAKRYGVKVDDGINVRLANIEVTNDNGLGIFDCVPDGETSKGLADKLRQYTESRHYGTAGPEFLQHLVADIKENGLEAFTKNLENGLTEFQKTVNSDTDPMVGRVARRFALVAVAGELAIQYGVLPWKENTALKAAQVCFQVWRKGFKSKAEQEADFIEYILSYPEIHRQRFDIVAIDISGKYKEPDPTGYDNRLGVMHVKDDGGGKVFYIPKMFVEEVLGKRGYQKAASLKILKENDLIIGGSAPSYQYKVPSKGMHGLKPNMRYLCIRLRENHQEGPENADD